MDPFTYVRTVQTDEAIAEARAGATFLAGGTTLLVVDKLAPTPRDFPRRVGLPNRKPLA